MFGLDCVGDGVVTGVQGALGGGGGGGGGGRLALLTPLPTGHFDLYPGGLFRRFVAGDVVRLVREPARPSGPSSNGLGAPGGAGDGDVGAVDGAGAGAVEATVVDKGPSWLQVSTGQALPAGVEELGVSAARSAWVRVRVDFRLSLVLTRPAFGARLIDVRAPGVRNG